MQQLNLEEQLEHEKIISPEQLQTIRLEQQRSSVSLVQAMRQLKVVSEEKLLEFLGKHLHLEAYNLKSFVPDKELMALLPAELLWQKKVLPLYKDNFELAVGVLDPLDATIYDELRFRTGLFIKPYLVREDELVDILTRCCDRREAAREAHQDSGSRPKLEDTFSKEEFSKPSIIEAVNLLLLQALKFGASDIHIEAQRDKMRLRLRIDGVLKEITPPESTAYNAFVSRIKIMANLDIAERRQPQDGRFNVELDNIALDVRVSVIPTIERESIVLRLLKQNKKVLTLNQLGMASEHLTQYENLIRKPSGIILVTGPTGSGKTTTLYASLSIIQSVQSNIITIEDPVEYHLDFCRQIQVNQKVNLTFANGLRSILRHDPDIIMVGEIRDLETATIAIQAALTGHLVFSTLHTNDAASAITRLVDMGIEPFLIASCLNGVVAQRLVRVLCKKCAYKKEKRAYKEAPFVDKEIEVWEAKGCQDCLHTGFSGRVGIFEIMEMTPEIGRLTVEKASSTEIIKQCRSTGMRFMYDDGWDKIIAGSTNVAEVLRVLGPG
jgi:type IV pilus assembly protein PilB